MGFLILPLSLADCVHLALIIVASHILETKPCLYLCNILARAGLPVSPHPTPHPHWSRPQFCISAGSWNWVVSCHLPALDREQIGFLPFLQCQMVSFLSSSKGRGFFLPRYLVSCPSSGLRLFPCKRVQDKNGVLCLFSMAADYLGFMPIATNIRSSTFPQSFWKQPVEGHGKEHVSSSRLSNRKYTKLITEERLYFSMVLE